MRNISNREPMMRVMVKTLSVIALIVSSAFNATSTDDRQSPQSCAGLHAGITAQLLPMYTETPSVMLAFLLLNDSDVPVDVEAGSWKIVIDGKELKDSGFLLGNGPHPVGGYRVLKPGEHYEFALSLSITEYFSTGGHRVQWKGSRFQSPTVTVKIDSPPR
jgi:hypothetical protein